MFGVDVSFFSLPSRLGNPDLPTRSGSGRFLTARVQTLASFSAIFGRRLTLGSGSLSKLAPTG